MSRFLFATVPVIGHVSPGLAIARELVSRGHEVRWYTGRRFRAVVEATGAAFEPIEAAIDPADDNPLLRFPERARLTGLAGFKFDLKHFFLDEVPGQIADLRRILAEFPADVLLGDTGFLAAGLFHELGGPIWATYGMTALTINSRDTAPFGTALAPATTALGRARNRIIQTVFDRVLFRDVREHLQQHRLRLGLARGGPGVLAATLSPYLYLQSSTPAFEYARSDLPPQVRFIGPLLPEPAADFSPPAWWEELGDGKPVVLVNQGTIANTLDNLIKPALEALSGEDMLVVATTGGAPVSALGQLPPNARVAPFLPFGALLPHISVMVTNGGYGGVQFALANGVPLVVAGTTEEKPEIAARVAWSGAGINLKTGTPTAEQIRAAVHTVLGDAAYRRNAQRIGADYARHDAPREAATLLEQLAARHATPVERASHRVHHREAVGEVR